METEKGFVGIKAWNQKFASSGWLKILTHGELRLLKCISSYMNEGKFFCFLGTRKIKELTGLDLKHTPKICLILHKLGFILSRAKVKVKGGSLWGYFINPEIPAFDVEKHKKVRGEVIALRAITNKEGKRLPWSELVIALWAVSDSPFELKTGTTYYNDLNRDEISKKEEAKKPNPEKRDTSEEIENGFKKKGFLMGKEAEEEIKKREVSGGYTAMG